VCTFLIAAVKTSRPSALGLSVSHHSVETTVAAVWELSTVIHKLTRFFATAELEWLKIAYMAVSVRESRTLNTRQPFSRADARKAGIALRELLSPRFHKIFYDCYIASTFPRCAAIGDSLIRACRTSARELLDAALAWRGRGAKQARRAARYVRDGVDSAMESRLRMLLVLAGLPAPQVNFIVRHPDGSWRMRFDLCYPALKLIIEYDGRQHAMNSAQWQRDLKRREELDALGWRIIVVTAADLYDAPEQVLARVRDALVERGATGIRRHFKTEWLRYFTAS
jgi:very-short-patch-repair endonuclease